MPVTILAFVVVFSIVVFIHELGHFTVAKLARVRVEEFGFGFPPRLLRIAKRGDTEYTLNLIPIGGFVRVAGDENAADPQSMAQRSPWVRSAFLLAGPAMNAVLAIVLFSFSAMLGIFTPVEGRPGVGIYDVEPGSPAAAAGLQVGDTILSVDGQPVNSMSELTTTLQSRLGQQVALAISRDGQALPAPVMVTLRANPEPDQGAMGVGIGKPLAKVAHPPWSAVWLGLTRTVALALGMIGGLVAMVRGLVPADLAGPIGIAQMTGQIARTGFVQLIDWTAFLSVNLFILNLLPIPALDGGRLLFVGLELVRGGRRVDPQKEGFVHFLGLLLLLGFFLVVSYLDLGRLAQGTPFP